VAALDPARRPAEDSSTGLFSLLPTGAGPSIADSVSTGPPLSTSLERGEPTDPGRRGFRGGGCGRAVSSSMPAPAAMESELVPSCLEGAVFPELPGAAGVIAIAHYRRLRKSAGKNVGATSAF